MGLFEETDVNTIFLSRKDPYNPLSTYSKHEFELEDKIWPSAEHYYQAMKFDDENYREKIRQAPHPEKANKLGNGLLKRWSYRKDWKDIQVTIMTRALYTKSKAYLEVQQALLDTGDQTIKESSLYDYFWGVGRDRRGKNMYGKVLENIRAKLLEEQQSKS